MNKGSIVCAVAAALIGGGLIWAVGSKEDTGIAGWETLNVSMEQAVGTVEVEASVAQVGRNSQEEENSKLNPKTADVQGAAGEVKSNSAAVDGVQAGVNAVVSSVLGSEITTPAEDINGAALDNSVSADLAAQSATEEGKINVNIATSSELMNLPGIGKKKAQAIIDYRNRLGAFNSLSDLGKVKGIGTKMLEKLKPLVVF